MSEYFVPAVSYLRRWDDAMSPTDHELVEDHSRCQDFWPECKENAYVKEQGQQR